MKGWHIVALRPRNLFTSEIPMFRLARTEAYGDEGGVFDAHNEFEKIVYSGAHQNT